MPKIQRPEEFTLSNGIPVIIQNYDAPVAASYWWIRTGSGDERPPEAGFAHFLEHMLFKDAAAKETGRASTGQMATAVESLGGDINAYTSFDQTVYHVTCAAHHWEKVLDAFGTMAKPQKFLKSDFEREREVILEELAKNEDSPGRVLFQKLFSATFAKHPYGKPVIGFVKTLKAAKVTDLEAFYKRQYVSGNMGLVLVGPYTEARKATLIKLLEKHYGQKVLPKKTAPLVARASEPELRKTLTSVKKGFDVKTPTLSMSFRAPGLRHPDIAALDLAASVLSMGELSRLYQKLFYGSSVATEVGGGLYVPNDPGMLYFQVEMDSVAKINAAATELLGELDRIRNEGPTDDEISRVLVNAESERLYATQSADGIAGRLGFLKFTMGDLNYDQQYLEDLRDVDSKTMKEVLNRYLDYRRMSLCLLLPKAEDGFDMKSIEEQSRKILKPAAEAAPAKKAKATSKKSGAYTSGQVRPEFFTLPSGVRVIYRERPQSQVMSIHSVAMGGLRLELNQPVKSAESDWGSSNLMANTWTKGTASKDARAIAALVEGSAAGMDGFSGRHTVGVQTTGLARDFNKLANLFNEVLIEPTFPDSEVDHSRRVVEESIKSVDDHSGQLCSKLFLETLFENHPYSKFSTGSFESIRQINSAKLKAFHSQWIRPERLILTVVGNVKRRELDSWLAQFDSHLKSKTAKLPALKPLPSLREELALKAPRWVEKNLGREQVHILVGGLGIRLTDEERYGVRLMQTLLGGQSGRLFIELREKKSLAYTVAPVSFEGMEKGYIGTYIACSPQKKDDALAGIRQVLELLANKGPKESEMKRAQEYFLGRRAMDLQGDSSIAASYGLESIYDLPFQDDAEIIKKIESVRPKDIQEICRKFLVEPHLVTSVVG
ncbi:MAG: insulinase family protein [Methylotenera sp.]|nr:insulinase family protein [Oligoflexia bacterium]